jgi:hypothetical protein
MSGKNFKLVAVPIKTSKKQFNESLELLATCINRKRPFFTHFLQSLDQLREGSLYAIINNMDEDYFNDYKRDSFRQMEYNNKGKEILFALRHVGFATLYFKCYPSGYKTRFYKLNDDTGEFF